MASTQIRSGAVDGQVQGPAPEPDQDPSPTRPDYLKHQAFLAWLGIWLGLSMTFEWSNVALTKEDPTPGVIMSWLWPLLEHPYRSSLGIVLILGAMGGGGRVLRGMK